MISQGMLPVIVVLGILGLLGVVGNIMSVTFFARCKRSSTTVLIICLTASDLLVSIMIIPKVIELSTIVSNTNKTVCQVTHFLTAWSVCCSRLFLCVIAIDRYRKICQAFRQQLTLRSTQLAVVLIVLIGSVLSLKYFFFTDIVAVTMSDAEKTTNLPPTGSYCTTTTLYRSSFAFDVLDCVICLVIWSTIITLYTRIILKLVAIKRKRKSMKGTDTRTSRSPSRNTKANNPSSTRFSRNSGEEFNYIQRITVNMRKQAGRETLKLHVTSRCKPYSTAMKRSYSEPDILDTNKDTVVLSENFNGYMLSKANSDVNLWQLLPQNSPENNCPLLPPKCKQTVSEESLASFSWSVPADVDQNLTLRSHRRRRRLAKAATSAKENQTTVMLCIVSLTFIVCVVPYLLIKVLVRQVYSAGAEAELRIHAQFALVLIYVQSVLNPIFYFIFNNDFRQFVKCKGYQQHNIVSFYPHYFQ